VNGRKRHILIDTTGLLLKVVVHPADVQDRDGAKLLLTGLAERFPRLAKLWVDAAYQGPCATWIAETLGWTVEVVRKPSAWVWVGPGQEPPTRPAGFQVLPRRWVVERTFAWLGRYRRLSKDYEVLPATEETWIYLAMSRLMTARLAR
jgi:transposase